MFPIEFLLLLRGFNYLFSLRYISLFLFVDFCFLLPAFLSPPYFFYFTVSLDLSVSLVSCSLSLSLYSLFYFCFAQNGSSIRSDVRSLARSLIWIILFQFQICFEYHSLLFALSVCVSEWLLCGVCVCLDYGWMELNWWETCLQNYPWNYWFE